MGESVVTDRMALAYGTRVGRFKPSSRATVSAGLSAKKAMTRASFSGWPSLPARSCNCQCRRGIVK
jgi:hypothetical protein